MCRLQIRCLKNRLRWRSLIEAYIPMHWRQFALRHVHVHGELFQHVPVHGELVGRLNAHWHVAGPQHVHGQNELVGDAEVTEWLKGLVSEQHHDGPNFQDAEATELLEGSVLERHHDFARA
jgi:hypothetical protein